MDEKVENLKQAIANGELFEYLVGEKDYGYICPYADLPTYPSDVFGSLVSYCRSLKDASIWRYFESSLLAMSADKTYSWLSLYYLVQYLRYARREQPIDLTTLSQEIIKNISSSKVQMSRSRRWVGSDYVDGLWGDVKRMVNNINEEFGLKLSV